MLRASCKVFTRRQSTSLLPQFKIKDLEFLRDKGITGLYSSKGLNNVWYDKADYCRENLNQLLQQSVNKNALLSCFLNKSLDKGSIHLSDTSDSIDRLNQLISTAAQSCEGSESFTVDHEIYNLSTQLYNHHFAMSSLNSGGNESNRVYKPDASELLKTHPNTDVSISLSHDAQLLKQIKSSFGSLEQLKTLLINSSLAIKGNGFTWLIALFSKSDSKLFLDDLYVVNSYNNGTPSDRLKNGQLDDFRAFIKEGNSNSEFVKDYHQNDSFDFVPLLAINASPYAYLSDYGVFGKRVYLENVWNCINWPTVASRWPKEA
ncbi:37S ribosomal protein, mitochondrial [Komagataella phaffii CBS 7435]|uniref:Mitochondrial ribosomal protein of the small subunit n=2 Tax=Komagataella phaffii TaxID=460519 RepID=C4R016_KOMPG|nr:Mitochondrial ribosomal protein of the small subunit [Komagataella phaffii GS115]AOA62711.1 GQ67_00258T0 [Komagataella phaffii]CAH2448659.1 37S ribosomal protein, mitochondrial [Komagataella phaffii CBS 7435]AOA67120.1 GQ68_01131T0 [Komagataella phaffii GS115]CAY68840.1 Mitochondrial ribosomal protein of the small subunit [Komagataella phaffii GS115]CCA38752.1 37S ribosomal protein, mitochondrial [Komagataella phaffii CBS 7435]